jgi:hypothetical protein
MRRKQSRTSVHDQTSDPTRSMMRTRIRFDVTPVLALILTLGCGSAGGLHAQVLPADTSVIMHLVADTLLRQEKDLPSAYLDSMAVIGGEARHDARVKALNERLAAILDTLVGRRLERIPNGDTTHAGVDELRRRALAFPIVWTVDSATFDAPMGAAVYITTIYRRPKCSSIGITESQYLVRRKNGAWRVISVEPTLLADASC